VSRSIPSALLTHYRSGGTTLAWACKITRTDGQVFGWTSHDVDVTISGVQYQAAPGLNVAALASTAGFAVDNTEATILADEVVFKRAEILAGRWDAAAFELFRYNWASPSDGRDVIKRGQLGNVNARRGTFVVELRSLRQALQQSVGAVVQPTCRYRLGSTTLPDGLCMVDLGPFTFTGSVTSVTNGYQFGDTARTEADDYFTEGLLTWTSGDNDGLSVKVHTYTTGVLRLSLPMTDAIQVGDTYSVVAGCMKRRDEDCRDKFDNAVRFGGEPDLPGADAILAAPAGVAN
jgi:uncharacterized phage protein (TIGR02218 family)